MPRRLAVILLACGAVVATARDASACSRFSLSPGPNPAPACQAAWDVEAVFVGTVVDYRTARHDVRLATTRVRVTEVSRGDVPPEVEFVVSSTCDYPFADGKTYVIYARRGSAGQLTADIHDGTRPLARATGLDYLRSLPGPPPVTGTIEGTTVRRDGSGSTTVLTPVTGVRVTAESGGRVWSATSGDDGRYRIEVPAGTYRLTADPPPGSSSSFAPASRDRFVSIDPDTVTIVDTRACVNASWWISPD